MESNFCSNCNNTGKYAWNHRIIIADLSGNPKEGEMRGESYCFCEYGKIKRENRKKFSNELDRFLLLSDDEVLEIIKNKERQYKAETN